MGTRKLDVLLLFGGVSSEHDVSCRSAESCLRYLDREKYDVKPVYITREGGWFLCKAYNPNEDQPPNPEDCQVFLSPSGIVMDGKATPVDVAFPMIHGGGGEDGTLQGLFEVCGIKYVGCGVLSSALAFHKGYAKMVFKHLGIKQADWIEIDPNNPPDFQQVKEGLGTPVFIKPCRQGSSVGIAKASTEEQFYEAVKNAAKYDNAIIAEQFIAGREIECAVLCGNPSVLGEIIPSNEFYDYNAKYQSGDKSELIIPAPMDEDISERIKETAKKVFAALDCKTMARVDFFLDGSDFYLNEVNTLPGFTDISMYSKLLMHNGAMTYSQLLDKLIEASL